ncbi:thiol reductant ABC exporter subunit CydD [Geobacter argillaceus]|uniref:ATP-binding cassette subfamily C protein CydD n=1 Tax=Geobacter argillaceus TaxID=345631 RepID=A0A562VIL2_9BACT|nr:thiol reductant ABC exporter subunit CydD [Geobacter argillaceus]TWJ17755.1 ATP-binding cassette subfamily C protein CydD [Geobacter argillaceus]
MGSNETNNNKRPETWLLGEAKGVRGRLAGAVCLAFCAGLLIILQARFLALACHRVVIGRAAVADVLPLAGGVALLAILRGLLTYLAERQSAAAAARLKERVRSALYRHILALSPAGRAGEETGPLVEVVTSGVEGLEPYVARFLPHLALAAFLPVLALAFVLPAEWRGSLVLLFSAPFIPLFMVLIGRGSESLNRRQWGRLSRMAGHLLDLVQGLPDLKIFGAVRREAAMVARVSEEYRQATMAVLRLAFLSAFTLEFFATVGTAVVAVLVGFRLLSGHLSLADGLFVLLLAPEFYLPLRTLGLSYHSRMQGVAAAERIAPLLDLPAAEGYGGTLQVPTGPLTVRFEGVSFRYAGDRGGVTGVDLELPSGSLTALAGESGSGKSTLVRLLAGLIRPSSGTIRVNGIDLAQLDPAGWHGRLAFVPQRPFFFKGTIRDNLLLGCPQTDGEAIRRALDAAHASPFIDRLPSGLGTVLGDRGAGLSGGELRRLALARVFLRDAALVVLDEPTAGLDAESERLVGEALERLATGRTMLLISHREGLLRRAERVAVLAAGTVERVVSPTRFLDGEEAP